MHAMAHGVDTAADGRLLAQGQLAGDTDDARQIHDELALGRDGPLRQLVGQIHPEQLRIGHARHGIGETFHVQQRVRWRDLRLILDGVGDAAQQVGVGDRTAQIRGQLRNGQRKRTRDGGKDLLLISLIGMARVGGF